MFRVIKHRIPPILHIQSSSYSTGNNDRPRRMPPELTKQTDMTKERLAELTNADDLKWRTPWHQKEGQHYTMLRTFYSEHNNTSVMKFLQSPINFRPSAIKAWLAQRRRNTAIALQQYIPERNQTLGNELAAAHFIVYRGGSVKFFGQDFWIKADQFGNYNLPDRFESNWFIQAIDCSNVELFYEGLVNMRDLERVEWFSVNGCENMDDWCMDRIANIFARTLLYLDIRDCRKITYRGLGALVKMNKLKILYLDDILYSKEYEMTCLMLQQLMPQLDIRNE